MITFNDVVKRYPRTSVPALDGVSFHVDEGEFVFVVGASGSGKSTLVRLLLAEERVTSGSLTALGADIVKMPRRKVPKLRRRMGVVFQDYRLLPDRTVAENVGYVLRVVGRNPQDIAQIVPETLDLVGLAHLARRRPHELSGGEQQRVALARALVQGPELLLADEPTGNLDPDATAEIVGLLERVNDSGTTILMATHNDRVVDGAGHRVIALDRGKVVRDAAVGTYLGASVGVGRHRVRRPSETGQLAATAGEVVGGLAAAGDTGNRRSVAAGDTDQSERAGETTSPERTSEVAANWIARVERDER